MRHTFIPTDMRRSLRHEYRVRAAIVTLFMFSLAGTIGFVSLMPAFVRAKLEKDAIEKALEPMKAEVVSSADALTLALRQTSALTLFTAQSKSNIDYTRIVEDIVSVRNEIEMSSFTVSRVSTTTVNVTIHGIAPTREALLSFKSRIESMKTGNKVDLPISQLAKNRDIPFSLSIVTDGKKP